MSIPVATITSMAIHPPNVNPCYGEGVIIITMVDESGGPFFELMQDGTGPIRADLEDLHELLKAAERMIAQEVQP